MDSYLGEKNRKALYLLKVVNIKSGLIYSELGYAFIMGDESNPEQVQYMVSSTSVFKALQELPRSFTKSNDIEIQAERYHKPKNKERRILKIKLEELNIEHSIDPGISFVKNFGALYQTELKSDYWLIFGRARDPFSYVKDKNPIKAFAFKDKSIIELQLTPNSKGTAFEVTAISDKDFVLDRARGAPIMVPGDLVRQEQVIGVLEVENRQCHPIFFKEFKHTFTSTSQEVDNSNIKLPSEGTEPGEYSGGLEKTDSGQSSPAKAPDDQNIQENEESSEENGVQNNFKQVVSVEVPVQESTSEPPKVEVNVTNEAAQQQVQEGTDNTGDTRQGTPAAPPPVPLQVQGRRLFDVFDENLYLKDKVSLKLDLHRSFVRVAAHYGMDRDVLRRLEDRIPGDHPGQDVLEWLHTVKPGILVIDFIKFLDTIPRKDISAVLQPFI